MGADPGDDNSVAIIRAAAAAPSAPAPPAPPLCCGPAAIPPPPKGYPHPFYPAHGLPPRAAAAGRGGGRGAGAILLPVPPFGMYPPLVQAMVQPAADTKKAEEEKKWKRGKGKTNGVNAVGTIEVNGNGASADAGEGAANKDAEGADSDGTRAGTPER
ncbi:hypothetical protein B0H14DRAFT_3494994 [Mycena olivaceomarginata]|nr:hypothetical protein B0H14DRAFT_3494994 [Mycena olivaceomarginata]